MGIGRVLGAAAPIAAGFMTGGAATPFLGMTGATAGLAAGALTGAGLAALTGQDPLVGGFTGALGGYGGADLAGGLGSFGKTAAEKTMLANKFVQNPVNAAISTGGQNIAPHLVSSTNPIGNIASVQNAGVMPSFMTASKGIPAIDPTKFVGTQQPGTVSSLMTQSKGIPLNTPKNLDTMMAAGGYGGGPDIGLGISEALDRPTDFFKEFGGGSTTKGALKTAGTLGSPLLAAFEPEVQTFDELRGDKYDPTRSLNLDNIDTGIGAALKRDTGLRLIKEGGHIKGYKGGGGLGLKSLMNSGNTQGSATNTSTGAVSDLSGQSILDMLRSKGIIKYENGGYLETGGRVGDGMSDDIKATINNSQPARLSDGEFVVPADVVSHLGNGSSDAGAKRLYDMMDKIRQARTGNKKQGKEINPERYMPA